jgi:hypothetical protein
MKSSWSMVVARPDPLLTDLRLARCRWAASSSSRGKNRKAW